MNIDDKHVETIITSLVYSKKAIREYPHPDSEIKSDSMRPIEGALEDVREAKRRMK